MLHVQQQLHYFLIEMHILLHTWIPVVVLRDKALWYNGKRMISCGNTFQKYLLLKKMHKRCVASSSLSTDVCGHNKNIYVFVSLEIDRIVLNV